MASDSACCRGASEPDLAGHQAANLVLYSPANLIRQVAVLRRIAAVGVHRHRGVDDNVLGRPTTSETAVRNQHTSRLGQEPASCTAK
jgi:hypothetical protein